MNVEDIEKKYNIKFGKEYEESKDIIIEIFNNNIVKDNYDLSNPIILNIIGIYYCKNKNYEKTIEYYTMAINLGNSMAMNNLGNYYYDIEKNYEKTIEYYTMAFNLNDPIAMNNLGVYYCNVEKNYEKAIKYYMMAINLGNSSAIYNLGSYYYKIEENYEKAIEYYMMSINLGNFWSMNNIKLIMNKYPFIILNTLTFYPNPNEFIKEIITELNKTKEIIIFKNKVTIFTKFNIVTECPICLETKLNINLECGHLVCIDCYPKINKCYLKCIN